MKKAFKMNFVLINTNKIININDDFKYDVL